MSKQIIVRDVRVLRELKNPSALFIVLLKDFTKTDIKAFMDAEDIFRVMSNDSDSKLIFFNVSVKDAFFLQLSASDKILFEKLKKNIYYK
jgi:hypothetical protein